MAKAKRKPQTSPGWLTGQGDVGLSLVLIAPLLFLYELGVLFTSHMNGADLITRLTLRMCGGDPMVYVAIHFAVALLFVAWLWRLRGAHPFAFRVMAVLLLECAIYASSMAAVIHLALGALGLGITAAAENLILAIGAGVHEELVFRLLLLGGVATLLRHLGVRQPLAIAAAFVCSAALFAAAHHIGALGEAFSLHAFMFRFVAGLLFGAIFWWRSLAHAVYAHAMYDVLVMVL